MHSDTHNHARTRRDNIATHVVGNEEKLIIQTENYDIQTCKKQENIQFTHTKKEKTMIKIRIDT